MSVTTRPAPSPVVKSALRRTYTGTPLGNSSSLSDYPLAHAHDSDSDTTQSSGDEYHDRAGSLSRRVSFNTAIIAVETPTYSKKEYKRGSSSMAKKLQLSSSEREKIKKEVVAFKLKEMQVHPESREMLDLHVGRKKKDIASVNAAAAAHDAPAAVGGPIAAES